MNGRRRKEEPRKADVLLKHILIALSSPVCIVRAAATCRRWRRIIGRGDYMRVLRSTPLLDAGHYQAVDPRYAAAPRGGGGNIVYVVPSTSPAPTVDARRFALNFLPGKGSSWELVDSHGSLLLLAKTRRRRRFPELLVCEPVARRYEVIPLIPEKKYSHCLTVFFWNGDPNMLDFSLRCVLHEPIDGAAGGVSTARIYDFRRRYWSHHRQYWNRWFPRKSAIDDGVHLRATEDSSLHFAGRTARCLFLGTEDDGAVLSLDMRYDMLYHAETRFLFVRLPDNLRGSYDRSAFRFIDGDHPDDVLLVSVVDGDLKVFLRRDGSDGWELEKSLHLPEATRGIPGHKDGYFGGDGAAKIVSASAGYVVLTPAEETWLFSVELATMEGERKHSRNRYGGEFCPYHLPWPPTVRAHVSYCTRRRKGLCFQICVC